MRALDTREHITTTYLAAWQIDLGAWWVIDIGSSRHPNMCVYGWGRCQKYRSVRVSETEKYTDKFADNKMEIQSGEVGHLEPRDKNQSCAAALTWIVICTGFLHNLADSATQWR